MKYKSASGSEFGSASKKRSGVASQAKARGLWKAECRDKNGNLKWVEMWENLIVNEGLNYLLDAGLSGGTQITSWFLGLINASPTIAAGDTMSSHSGWTENTAYDEATREAWTDGGVSGQSVSNSGSPAVFTGSTDGQTLGGAFLTSNSTKGGTSGTLYAVGEFSTTKNLDDGDTLTVTATFTQADDGV